MTTRVNKEGLQVAKELHDLIEERVLPGTGIGSAHFWKSLEEIIRDLSPKIRSLLERRNELQTKIDAWHKSCAGKPLDAEDYKEFLSQIGYLLPEGPDFQVSTGKVDEEISQVAGPQLVVPVMNARYALNAANARWGSLYDALYGTDVISEADGCQRSGTYNPKRGARVISFAREFLDQGFPIATGSHQEAAAYSVRSQKLIVRLNDNSETG